MMDRQTNLPLVVTELVGELVINGLGQAYKRTNGWTDKRTENLSARMHLKRIRERVNTSIRPPDTGLISLISGIAFVNFRGTACSQGKFNFFW